MVAFREFLSKKSYYYFKELCVAIRILSMDDISNEYITFAKKLLAHFVSTFFEIRGKIYISHNIQITLYLLFFVNL